MSENKLNSDFLIELDSKVKEMSWPVVMPISFNKLLNGDNKIAIIDVREKADCCFEDARVDSSSLFNIPFNSLVSQIGEIDLSSYDIIVTICFAGPKGAVAASIMRWMGYDNAFFLKGGVEELSDLYTS